MLTFNKWVEGKELAEETEEKYGSRKEENQKHLWKPRKTVF